MDPTTKLYSKYAYDPYVRDDCWMTDDDGDGTWELYVFDENGYLCTDVDINGMGYTTWGLHDAYGRLSTQYYKGVWDDVGPIQVVNHDNAWYCENGTLPHQMQPGASLVIMPVMLGRFMLVLNFRLVVCRLEVTAT